MSSQDKLANLLASSRACIVSELNYVPILCLVMAGAYTYVLGFKL